MFFSAAPSYEEALAAAIAAESAPVAATTSATTTAASKPSSSYFQTSSEVLQMKRRAVKSSPPPPKRTPHVMPSLGGVGASKVQVLPSNSNDSSVNSEASTISDVGTAVSLRGTSPPYLLATKVPRLEISAPLRTSDATVAASAPLELHCPDAGTQPQGLVEGGQSLAPRPFRPDDGGDEHCNAPASSHNTMQQPLSTSALRGGVLPFQLPTTKKKNVPAPNAENERPAIESASFAVTAQSRSTGRRDAEAAKSKAMEVIARWVRWLRWKGKWVSPFAVTVRGQIMEAKQMIKEESSGQQTLFAVKSLETQVNVWKQQLLAFLDQPTADEVGRKMILGLLQHQKKKRVALRKDSVREAGGSHEANGTQEDPLEEPAGSTDGGAPTRRTPLKMLRRGDGLARRGLAPPSTAAAASAGEGKQPTEMPLRNVSVVESAEMPSKSLFTAIPSAPLVRSEKGGTSRMVAIADSPPTAKDATRPPSLTSWRPPQVAAASAERAQQVAMYLQQVIVGETVDLSPNTKAQKLQRILLPPTVLEKRRRQFLSTLFQNPADSSPGSSSFVPRLNATKHASFFEGTTSTASPFGGTYRHRPEALQAAIESAMATPLI